MVREDFHLSVRDILEDFEREREAEKCERFSRNSSRVEYLGDNITRKGLRGVGGGILMACV